ncbi:hypothetical protein JCM10207_008792 [Rhodosporidiobolus poonsookiae]
MITEACLIGPTTEEEVDEYLARYKPSANSTEHGPWYWVQLPRGKKDAADSKPAEERADEHAAFEEEGKALEKGLVEQCAWIKDNAPVRANKKQGTKSQKELREAEHAKFNDDVAQLAKKHNVLSGKWLFFSSGEFVDLTWAKIVKAIALEEGPLAKTGAVHCAKVASTPGDGGDQHVICVYCDDSWDKDAVAKVFKTLVTELSLVSSAYKADANTIIGIDSKHASGIRSSLYGKTDFMTKDEIDEAFKAKTKAKEVKKKTLEQEQEAGGEDGFDEASESEDERPRKKGKTAK